MPPFGTPPRRCGCRYRQAVCSAYLKRMLHLTKTAVKCAHVGALEERNAGRREVWEGRFAVPIFTRYRPTRHAELVGGSLYWIVAHVLTVRQEILAIEEVGTAEGKRCRIWLADEMIPVQPRRKRAHQGWRYLEHARRPDDLLGGPAELGDMPQSLVRELAGLGLL